MTVLAWHNDPALRERIVARMREHREQDNFIRLTYQLIDPDRPLGYRGCAIGCLLDPQPANEGVNDGCPCADCATEGLAREPDGGWHSEVERQFGIPLHIAYAIDNIFEGQDGDEVAAQFALDATEAIQVGADLSVVDEWCAEIRERHMYVHHRYASELLERLRNAPVPAPVGGESGE